MTTPKGMISLLLTKNCHYAILVAIEEGDQFTQQDDKEIYIKAKLDFPYSDDIIPINSTLCTPFTPLTSDKPQLNATLIYYISNQYLKRLRKKQSMVTLEVFRLSMDSTEELLGTVELKVIEAKEVVMRKGERRMAQIERFVADKGEWRPIGNGSRTKAKLKCGLFLLEMPHGSAMEVVAASTSAEDLAQHQRQQDGNRPRSPSSTVQRSVEATGIRSPTSTAWSAADSVISYHHHQGRSTESRTSSELGLELRSQLSETLRLSDNSSTNSSVRDLRSPETTIQPQITANHPRIADSVENDAVAVEEDDDYDKMPELEGLNPLQEEQAITADGNKYFAVGTGQDQFTLQLRILDAIHIAAIVGKFVNNPEKVEKAYFSFTIAEVDHECPVDFLPENGANFNADTWTALENMTTFLFQGEIDEIHDWLAEAPLILQLMIKIAGHDEEVGLASAKIYLEDVGLDMMRKSGILYDVEGNWYTNDSLQFAKLEIEVGLTEGWEENMSTL